MYNPRVYPEVCRSYDGNIIPYEVYATGFARNERYMTLFIPVLCNTWYQVPDSFSDIAHL